MGHNCCSKQKVKKGLWSPEEDEKLIKHVSTHGLGSWSSVPRLAGLERCGKSCRLRWINYLRPDLKRGSFSAQEERTIIEIHRLLGNKWSQIANHLPGRTDNEIKNFWNSSLRKKLLLLKGLDPNTHSVLPYPLFTSNNNMNITTIKKVRQHPTIINSQYCSNPNNIPLNLVHQFSTMQRSEFRNPNREGSFLLDCSSPTTKSFSSMDTNCVMGSNSTMVTSNSFEPNIRSTKEDETIMLNSQVDIGSSISSMLHSDQSSNFGFANNIEASLVSSDFDFDFVRPTFMSCGVYHNASAMDILAWDL